MGLRSLYKDRDQRGRQRQRSKRGRERDQREAEYRERHRGCGESKSERYRVKETIQCVSVVAGGERDQPDRQRLARWKREKGDRDRSGACDGSVSSPNAFGGDDEQPRPLLAMAAVCRQQGPEGIVGQDRTG